MEGMTQDTYNGEKMDTELIIASIITAISIITATIAAITREYRKKRPHDTKKVTRKEVTEEEEEEEENEYERIQFRDYNVGRIVSKLIAGIIALYTGTIIIEELGKVMNGTTSQYYRGLSLIGWSIDNNTITSTNSSGIILVIGVVTIASVVMEFVRI